MSAGSGFDQLHIAHLLDVYATPDLTVPADPVMADCAAALAIIRNQFADAHRRVDTEAARFLADCQRLTVEATR